MPQVHTPSGQYLLIRMPKTPPTPPDSLITQFVAAHLQTLMLDYCTNHTNNPTENTTLTTLTNDAKKFITENYDCFHDTELDPNNIDHTATAYTHSTHGGPNGFQNSGHINSQYLHHQAQRNPAWHINYNPETNKTTAHPTSPLIH